MNRRQLLRDLAVFSASALAITSGKLLQASDVFADQSNRHLNQVLLRARAACRKLTNCLQRSEMQAARSDVHELCLQVSHASSLIEHAHETIDQPHRQSAAFWQACADSFDRLTAQLALCSTAFGDRAGVFSEVQMVIKDTAEQLNVQTHIRLRQTA